MRNFGLLRVGIKGGDVFLSYVLYDTGLPDEGNAYSTIVCMIGLCDHQLARPPLVSDRNDGRRARASGEEELPRALDEGGGHLARKHTGVQACRDTGT